MLTLETGEFLIPRSRTAIHAHDAARFKNDP